MSPEKLISLLPYSAPFLFVDSINRVNDNSISGSYTFRENEFFYPGHFKNFPVTPGVILTETMAQIGVVCLGLYLVRDMIAAGKAPDFAMTSAQADFLRPVFPGDKVTVNSEKIYFRMGKLKCNVTMLNDNNETVCKGIISGMIKRQPYE